MQGQATLHDDLDKLAAWEEKWRMDFHPQKCSVFRVSRAKIHITFHYKLKKVNRKVQGVWTNRKPRPTPKTRRKNTTLMEEKITKYLGVDLQANQAWNHISKVTIKANSMLEFLRRNLRYAREEAKAQAYVSIVRSNLYGQ